MSRLGRSLRMLRHLRPQQVLWRLWYRARLKWFRSRAYAQWRLSAGGEGSLSAGPPAGLPIWPGDAENGRRIMAGTIRLLGEERPLNSWHPPEASPLWRFTLNYFEWLADLEALGAADTARALVAGWIAEHPRPDSEAWHPYPLSLRLVAWLRHQALLLDGADASFRRSFLASLQAQARHLPRVLERDVGGNHLIKNLKALVIAATCLEGHRRRLAPALTMLRRQIALQILPDGGHYERSPAYHLQVYGDLLDIQAVLGEREPWLDAAIGRMAAALAFFRHGDGHLALFNDGDIGSASVLATLTLPAPPPLLADSGYWRLQASNALVLFDCGRCCPDDLPAHAHADTLSFEFSTGHQRLVVNSGTHAYQNPTLRNRLRGTAAHSTLDIDGLDSAEVFGVFRLGRRPRRVEGLRQGDGAVWGSHDGYRFLGLIHRRRLLLAEDGHRLSGEDVVERSRSGPRHTMTAHFHLHPDVVASAEDGAIRLVVGEDAWLFRAEGGQSHITEGIWSPYFGILRPNREIRVEQVLEGALAELKWSFTRL